ncbi:MAG: NHL repeat-containing protein, partial [Endomicrobiales bacterium]
MNNGFAGTWASVIAGGALLVCVPAQAGAAGSFITLSSTSYNGSSGNSAQAYGVAIDSDNVIVTGYIEQGARQDVLTVKYDPGLTRVLSFATFSGGNARGNAVTTDSQGNVIVAGQCQGDGLDILILKYNPDFTQLISSAVYTSTGTSAGNDVASGVAVDDEDNILVAGAASDGTTTDWLVLLYDPDLAALISSATFKTAGSGASAAYAVAADTAGNAFVTGQVYNGSNTDCLTIKYDSALQFISSMTYNGSGNGDDAAYGIFIDDEGSVWVTGRSVEEASRSLSLKYDPGLTRALASVQGPAGTQGRALGREPEGAVIVAGTIDAFPGSSGYIVRCSSDLARVISTA